MSNLYSESDVPARNKDFRCEHPDFQPQLARSALQIICNHLVEVKAPRVSACWARHSRRHGVKLQPTRDALRGTVRLRNWVRRKYRRRRAIALTFLIQRVGRGGRLNNVESLTLYLLLR